MTTTPGVVVALIGVGLVIRRASRRGWLEVARAGRDRGLDAARGWLEVARGGRDRRLEAARRWLDARGWPEAGRSWLRSRPASPLALPGSGSGP